MSVKILNNVWMYSQHKGSALLLLLAIADNAGDTGAAWPGIVYLAAKTKVSERTVIRLIQAIEKSGELIVYRDKKHNRYLVNVWPPEGPNVPKCERCGVVEAKEYGLSLHEQHVVPLSEGGLDDDDNKVKLCKECQKHAHDVRKIHDKVSLDGQVEDDENDESHDKNDVIHDTAMTEDPLTVTVIKKQELNSALIDSEEAAVEADTREASRDIAGAKDGAIEWFENKKQEEIKTGVRSPAEELPKIPRTEETVKAGVKRALLENAARNEEGNKDPVVETYLATVPEHVRELARVFCEHKKRPPLKKENKMWRREWQDQYDIGVKPGDVEKAISYMGKNNLGVRSPVSTLTIAENIRLGHIIVDEDRQVKSGEVSYDLPNTRVATAVDDEVSPMEELMTDD